LDSPACSCVSITLPDLRYEKGRPEIDAKIEDPQSDLHNDGRATQRFRFVKIPLPE